MFMDGPKDLHIENPRRCMITAVPLVSTGTVGQTASGLGIPPITPGHAVVVGSTYSTHSNQFVV